MVAFLLLSQVRRVYSSWVDMVPDVRQSAARRVAPGARARCTRHGGKTACSYPPSAQQAAGQGALTSTSSAGTGWDNLKATVSKFIPAAQKPPVEIPVPTVEWQPVTVLAPTLQVYKMGEDQGNFLVSRTTQTVQPAAAGGTCILRGSSCNGAGSGCAERVPHLCYSR